MTNKEQYFPEGTDIDTINSTLYTDYSFLATPSDTESHKTQLTDKEQGQVKALLNPPF